MNPQSDAAANNQLLNLLCSACNLSLSSTSVKKLLDKNYCDACFRGLAFQCSNCNGFYPRTMPKVLTDDFTRYCAGCIKKGFIPCYNCKKPIYKRAVSSKTIKRKVYCRNCFHEIGFVCNDCNKLFLISARLYCGGCYSTFCRKCYRNDDCRLEGIGDAILTFKTGKQSRLLSNYRCMAVEIEATCLGDNAFHLVELPKTFGKGRDESVLNGIEVKTPPCSGTEFIKTIRLATAALKAANYVADTHCGLHVHIDLRDKVKNFKFLAHLLTTAFAVEDILFAIQPEWRRRSRYCPALRTMYKFFDFYDKAIYEFDYRVYQRDKKNTTKDYINNCKHFHSSIERGAFNFQSVFFRGSLEVRLQAGSLDPMLILHWANLIQQIVRWVETSYNYETVLNLLVEKVTEKKLKMFRRVFKLSPPLFKHILSRLKKEKGMGYFLPFQTGTLPKKMRGDRRILKFAD